MNRLHRLHMLLTLALLLTGGAILVTSSPNAPANAAPGPARTSSQNPGDWILECVDCPRWFENLTDRSLQLDSSGYPHVAYGGDHLYYARHDGDQWVFETVDDAVGVGSYASLALDGHDRPHISYHDGVTGALKHAWHDGAVWQVETVDQVGNWYGHGYASLALDSLDQPHVSYYDYVRRELKYARHDGTQWSIEPLVTPQAEAGEYSSLALDASDRPHLVYFDTQLMYAWYNGESWETEPVDSGANLLRYPSLTLDSSGQPSVSYFDGFPRYELKYAWRDGTGWQIETVDEEGGWYASLGLVEMGKPHISYQVRGDLKLARRENGIWLLETIRSGDIAVTGWGTALALSADGSSPHILFRTSDGDLELISLAAPTPERQSIGHVGAASDDERVWLSETVDSSRESGWHTTLALDRAGQLHIAYHSGGLKYAQYDGTAWQIWTVDEGAHTGAFTSLALDSSGFAHISYQDWETGDLKYARHTGTIWLVDTVDRAGYVGEYSSLALDGRGLPRVSYFDRTNSDLKFAWHDGLAWHIATVPITDTPHAGMYTSLAIDGTDRPHISFEAGGALRYAVGALPVETDAQNELAWQVETVPISDTAQTGLYSSLALDLADRPHISYFDRTNGRLDYAWHDGSSWKVETVPTDTAAIVGLFSSLALDSEGNPHLAYYDETNADLKYAMRTGGGWQLETVAESGDVGRYAALALDVDGRPYISFYDVSRHDLWLARFESSTITTVRRKIFLPLTLQSGP